jgi:VWFA-related protein
MVKMTGTSHSRAPWWSVRLPALAVLLGLLLLSGAALRAQDEKEEQQQDEIPDAPSSARPQQPAFPDNIPPRPVSPPPEDAREPLPPAQPPPPAQVREAAPGEVPEPEGRDEIHRLVVDVQFVMVPVTVKDLTGRMVDGLLPEDFTILEDGVAQEMRYFTSDPFPLSAAVVLDLGMSDNMVRRLAETYPALIGAFSPYDEVAVFTYGNTVRKVEDFTASPERLSATFQRVRSMRGRTPGVPVTSGPLAGGGPIVGGKPLDPGAPQPHMRTPPRESRVLNDAILEAATELARRDRSRRKVLFVISDGREEGSFAGFADVLKVLLSNEISVYGVAVDGGAIPGYRTAQRIRIPGTGHGNILPQYASATGGQVFPELTAAAIEQAYARVTLEARNQYTLGYTTRATLAGNYRTIEVRVHRPNLRVHARDGYYPLPPRR